MTPNSAGANRLVSDSCLAQKGSEAALGCARNQGSGFKLTRYRSARFDGAVRALSQAVSTPSGNSPQQPPPAAVLPVTFRTTQLRLRVGPASMHSLFNPRTDNYTCGGGDCSTAKM
jgi:hypothetical protein